MADHNKHDVAHLEQTEAEIEKHGGELILTGAETANLLHSKDGILLVPQPSDDPNDPLNWSSFKKHAVLLTLAFAGAGADWQSAAAIPIYAAQAAEWGRSISDLNDAENLSVLMVGVGGVLWIAPCYFWGRLPVLFWCQVIGVAFMFVALYAQSYEVWYAARGMASLFLTAGQTIGLIFIRDMFFFHEHARKIGLWIYIFFSSPYLGPFFGGLMIDSLGDWRAVMWLPTAWTVLVLVFIIVFGHETYYDRTLEVQPKKGSRISELIGISQLRDRGNKPSVFHSIMRTLEVYTKPLMWMVFISYGVTFMWAIALNISSSILFSMPKAAGGYGLSQTSISLLYFTPLTGLVIGEIFGHWFNDFISNRYIRQHAGRFVPEVRLKTYFISVLLMAPGLVLVGQALGKQLHIAAVIMGWGIYVVGCMMASVSMTAFAMDSFPTAPGEVSALCNFSRTLTGFATGFFIFPWGMEKGFDFAFGITAVTIVGAGLLMVPAYFFGRQIRLWGGPLHFSNAAQSQPVAHKAASHGSSDDVKV